MTTMILSELIKMYICSICNEDFHKRKLWRIHLKEMHNK